MVLEKGGVGKSTSALMISDYLHRAGQRVLLIDLDSQYNPTQCLIPNYQGRAFTEALGGEEASQLPVVRTPWGFDLVPGDSATKLALGNVGNAAMARLNVCMSLSEFDYDYVIIDCPPTFGDNTVSAMWASDSIIVPFLPGAFELQGLRSTLQDIVQIQQYKPTLQLLGIMITQHWPNRLVSRQHANVVRSTYADLVFDTDVPYSEAIKKAMAKHISIEAFRETSPQGSDAVAEAYRNITTEIMERTNGHQ
jgi:chromosome partitioning protein